MLPREFVCVDCKAYVFNFGGGEDRGDRCYKCHYIRGLHVGPETEAVLRRVLDCELREKPDDE